MEGCWRALFRVGGLSGGVFLAGLGMFCVVFSDGSELSSLEKGWELLRYKTVIGN